MYMKGHFIFTMEHMKLCCVSGYKTGLDQQLASNGDIRSFVGACVLLKQVQNLKKNN